MDMKGYPRERAMLLTLRANSQNWNIISGTDDSKKKSMQYLMHLKDLKANLDNWWKFMA